MQTPALDEPIHLEPDASVDKRVEIATRMFERESVGVDELAADEEVDLRRQGAEDAFRGTWYCGPPAFAISETGLEVAFGVGGLCLHGWYLLHY